MRYLVTGATGFVGGALAKRLNSWSDCQVAALVRDGDAPTGCQQFRGELEDLRACERAVVEFRPDVVFHLAAQAIVPHAKQDPWATMESNVRGTYNLLEAFRRHTGHSAVFVMASSDKAYGELGTFADCDVKYQESDPLEGRGPYDCSKSCADLIAQSYAQEYGLRVGIVRAGNIYGPQDPDRTRIIPSIVADLAAGKDPTIMSDGTPVRDYLYISDAVEAYLAVSRYAFESGLPEAFNFSGGEPISVLDLVLRAIAVYKKLGWMDAIVPNVLGVRRGEISKQVLDCHKALTLLNWSPEVNLDEGLRKILMRI